MNLEVLDQKGSKVKDLTVDEVTLGRKVSKQVITDYVKIYLDHNKQKYGSTKLRAEVSGSGIKPWRQKGTGRARAGCTRSPLWRGGAIVFGPKPRKSTKRFTKNLVQDAMRSVLIDRILNKQVKIINDLTLASHKTKDFKKVLDGLHVPRSTLILTSEKNENLMRASRNIPAIRHMSWIAVNPYEVLRYKNLVMTESAYENIMKKYFEVKE